MVEPTPITTEDWARHEHFQHYLRAVPCTYSMTTEIDVTEFARKMRASTRKTYLAQVWALATVVNRHDEFKMCLTDDDQPAVWPVVHPSFTVFNPATETFASVWVPYHPDFGAFHDAAADVVEAHRDTTKMFPQSTQAPNTFDVSSLPWTSFTGFNLNIQSAWKHLAPIFTLGRYTGDEGNQKLPLALQVHHAAIDGFHASRLINELQELFAQPTWVE